MPRAASPAANLRWKLAGPPTLRAWGVIQIRWGSFEGMGWFFLR